MLSSNVSSRRGPQENTAAERTWCCPSMERIKAIGKQLTFVSYCTRAIRHSVFILEKDIAITEKMVMWARATHLIGILKMPISIIQLGVALGNCREGCQLKTVWGVASRVGEVTYNALQIIKGSKAIGWIGKHTFVWVTPLYVAFGPMIGVVSAVTHINGIKECRAFLHRIGDSPTLQAERQREEIRREMESHKLKLTAVAVDTLGASLVYLAGIATMGHVLLGVSAVISIVDYARKGT